MKNLPCVLWLISWAWLMLPDCNQAHDFFSRPRTWIHLLLALITWLAIGTLLYEV